MAALPQGDERSIYCRKAQAAHLRASLGLNQLGLNQTKKQLYGPATLTELDHTRPYYLQKCSVIYIVIVLKEQKLI